MMATYEVTHLKADGTQEVIGVVGKPVEIHLLVETPKYAGTWISKDRKILRHGKGEIRIADIDAQMRIIDCRPLQVANVKWYELMIENGNQLKSILLNSKVFIGYNGSAEQLWKTDSLTKLAEITNKEIAYRCSEYYDKFISEHNVTDAM